RFSGDVRQMLVEGDRAVVFVASHAEGRHCTYGYDCTFAGDGSRTRIVLVDIADRAHPKVLRQIELSGSLIASRRIGSAVHTVVGDTDPPEPYYETSPADIPFCREHEIVVRLKFDQLERNNERKIRAAPPTFPTITDRGVSRKLCDAMHTP